MKIEKDYYAIIGVLPSIDDAALTAVCRALLKKYHPDVNKGQNQDGRAADIIEAYRFWAVRINARRMTGETRYNISDTQPEPTPPPRQEDSWSAKHEEWWSARQEDLRSEKVGKKPSLVRTMLALWLLGFTIRSLIAASLFALIVTGLGPGGTLFTDTLKSLKTLSQLGNVNIKFRLRDS